MHAATLMTDTARTAPAGDIVALNELFEQAGACMPFARDEEIFGQDEKAEFYYKVVRGSVRTTYLLSDGRRQIGCFYLAGEIFGLEPGETHQFSAEAMCDSEVLVLKRSMIRNSDRSGVIERALGRVMAKELERTREHLMVLGRKSACERVASLLLDYFERAPHGSIELPMSRQDMADYLGLTIETVSRMITQLQGAHVIELAGSRRLQVRNRAALERLSA